MTLDDYISTKDLTDAEFGKLIGRSQSAISRLRRGKTMPDWETVGRIFSVTNGSVTANDFLPAPQSQEALQLIS